MNHMNMYIRGILHNMVWRQEDKGNLEEEKKTALLSCASTSHLIIRYISKINEK